MVRHRREPIVKKQLLWVVFRLIALDFMICTGMSLNGVKIFGTIIITVRRLMVVLGKVVEIVKTGCCAGVRGSAMPPITALRLVSTFGRTLATSASAVFGLFVRLRGLLSPLLFCSFALYSSFFFTFLVASGDSIYFFALVDALPTKKPGFLLFLWSTAKDIAKNPVSGHLCVSLVWENHCHFVNAFILFYKIELMQR